MPPASRAASASICGGSSRFKLSGRTCERAGQGGVNSGRKVSTINSGAVGAWSISWPSRSRVEASAQCTSSQTCRNGCRSDRIGAGEALQPGGQVGGLADHGVLARGALADRLADHAEPGRDADAHRKPGAVGGSLIRRYEMLPSAARHHSTSFNTRAKFTSPRLCRRLRAAVPSSAHKRPCGTAVSLSSTSFRDPPPRGRNYQRARQPGF